MTLLRTTRELRFRTPRDVARHRLRSSAPGGDYGVMLSRSRDLTVRSILWIMTAAAALTALLAVADATGLIGSSPYVETAEHEAAPVASPAPVPAQPAPAAANAGVSRVDDAAAQQAQPAPLQKPAALAEAAPQPGTPQSAQTPAPAERPDQAVQVVHSLQASSPQQIASQSLADPAAAPAASAVAAAPTTVAEPEAPLAAAPAPAEAQPAATPPLKLTPQEIAADLKRGEEKLKAGQLAAARLFFERVALGGDSRGAEGMAKTYDPEVLKTLPVLGPKPDPALARSWRDRAKILSASR